MSSKCESCNFFVYDELYDDYVYQFAFSRCDLLFKLFQIIFILKPIYFQMIIEKYGSLWHKHR